MPRLCTSGSTPMSRSSDSPAIVRIKGEADDRAAPAVEGKGQGHARHRQDPAQLGAGPGFAETVAERASITRMTASIWSAEPGAI